MRDDTGKTLDKVEHTPGPWEVRTGRANSAVYVAGTGHAVAVGIDKPQDARLIAAAPETACQRDELLAALERVELVADHEGPPTPEYLAAWAQARAALAKARGGSKYGRDWGRYAQGICVPRGY